MDDAFVNLPKDVQRIGLIAGSGQFPLLFAHAAAESGLQVVAVGFQGETDVSLAEHVEEFHLLKLGQLNRLIRTFQKAGITRAAMAGAINKTRIYTRLRPDWRAVKLLNKLRNKKDDFLLRAIAQELESDGIQIEASTLLLPRLLAPEGVLTRRKPNRREEEDIDFGWKLAKGMGHLDVGQCLVVKNQSVLAVEGIDGTDATILRGGDLCREGAVVIKVSKPRQDLRFDVPAVGLETIATMKRVNAKVLVIEAGKTIIFDQERMIDAADASGISVLVQKDLQEPGPDRSKLPEIGAGAFGSFLLWPQPRPAPAPVNILLRKSRPDAVRVGVVGVGYLGGFHAQKYARLPEARLIVVADPNEDRARAVADQLETEFTVNHRELIGRVEAVSIAAPTPFHHRIARDFLDAGVHVLLEKPMTQSVAEADDLIALAQRNGCILQIGHLERFNSALSAIRPHLGNPLFVEADRLALFNERGLDVDVVLDLMIHDIDLVLHIIDSPLKALRASGVAVLTALPDIASVRMEFANGAVANLTASRISTKNMRKLRVFQGNSYLVADFAERRAYAVYREEEPDEDGYPQVSMEDMEIEEHDALEDEIFAFLKTIRSGGDPAVGGTDGRRALSVALEISSQIEQQMRTGWRDSGGGSSKFF
jgi:DUF1009 family protein/predicted dehydrogenase